MSRNACFVAVASATGRCSDDSWGQVVRLPDYVRRRAVDSARLTQRDHGSSDGVFELSLVQLSERSDRFTSDYQLTDILRHLETIAQPSWVPHASITRLICGRTHREIAKKSKCYAIVAPRRGRRSHGIYAPALPTASPGGSGPGSQQAITAAGHDHGAIRRKGDVSEEARAPRTRTGRRSRRRDHGASGPCYAEFELGAGRSAPPGVGGPW